MAENKRNKKLKEKFEGKGKTPNRLSKNPISDRRTAIQRLAPASGKKGAAMTQKEYEKAIIDQENYNLGYSQGLKEQKNYMSPTSKFFRKAGGMGLYMDDNKMRAMPGLSEGDPKQKNLSPSRQGRLQARDDVSKTIKKKAGGAIKTVKELLSKKPPSAGKIAKKVENKARKESSAVAKKARKEARKNLKDDINYDRNVALKTKGAGAIGAAGVGGALYGRSKIKEAEKESEKRRANNKPTFEFKQLKKEPIKKKAGGALKAPTNPGLKKLPTKVRNKMGYMKSGGKVTSKCKRDGIAIRGRTKGRMV